MTEDGAQELSQALMVGVLDGSLSVADARAVGELMMGTLLPTVALRQRRDGGTKTSRQMVMRVTHTEMLLQVPVDDGPLFGQQVRQIIDGEVA